VGERVSAGILLFRRSEGQLEVLLAHPGGPFFSGRDAGAWTIPKGEPEPGDGTPEALEAAARREFAEETGHAVPAGQPIELGSVTQAGGKVVHAWAVEGDLDPEAAVANAFEMEWPPRSGKRATFPEVDRVAWFVPDEARRRMNPAQAAFVERLVAHLAAR
jgi:predicted NUDIX family NTP pyrophosphohydrolase